MYFLVLLVQTLLERELRRAMAHSKLPSLPLYPEGRACTRPTTQRIIELFEPVQRHVLEETGLDSDEEQDPWILITTLTPVQRTILQLLNLKPADYGN